MSDTDPPTGGTPADDATAASSSDDDAADATPIGDLVARLQVLRARLLALGWTRIRDTYRCETCGFLYDAGRHVDGSVKGCKLTAQGLTNPQNVGALYADMEEQVKSSSSF